MLIGYVLPDLCMCYSVNCAALEVSKNVKLLYGACLHDTIGSAFLGKCALIEISIALHNDRHYICGFFCLLTSIVDL